MAEKLTASPAPCLKPNLRPSSPNLTALCILSSPLLLFHCLNKDEKNNLSVFLRKGETLIGIPKRKGFPPGWRWLLQSRTCSCCSLPSPSSRERSEWQSKYRRRGSGSSQELFIRDEINVKTYLYQSRLLLAKETSVWKKALSAITKCCVVLSKSLFQMLQKTFLNNCGKKLVKRNETNVKQK